MADVFISHAAADSHFAEFLHRHLTQEGLSVYLASVSMPPGERWMDLELTPFHGHLIVQQEGVPNVKTALTQAAVPGAVSSTNG